MSQVQVKICGITLPEQAQAIVKMGADALGFILYPKSPRYITPEKIKEILLTLPPYVKTVGVVVNEPIEEVIRIYRSTGLDLIQLHGEETPEFCRVLNEEGVSWMKAFRVRENFDFSLPETYHEKNFLFDAWSDKEYGGTGESFDWQKIRGLSEKYNLVLAGGITPENASKAVEIVNPYGIDVSSGVEEKPGVKSLEKVERLFQNLRAKPFNA